MMMMPDVKWNCNHHRSRAPSSRDTREEKIHKIGAKGRRRPCKQVRVPPASELSHESPLDEAEERLKHGLRDGGLCRFVVHVPGRMAAGGDAAFSAAVAADEGPEDASEGRQDDRRRLRGGTVIGCSLSRRRGKF